MLLFSSQPHHQWCYTEVNAYLPRKLEWQINHTKEPAVKHNKQAKDLYSGPNMQEHV